MKKIFFKRHKNKLIALFIFCTGTLWFANYIGYQHIPGHVEYVVQNFIGRYFIKEEAPIDFERAQFLNDSFAASYFCSLPIESL